MFGRYPFGGVSFAGSDVADIPQDDLVPTLAVEVAFTTGALEEPAWVDITGDVRSWSTFRGRERELERFPAGRATIVLGNLDRQYDSQYAGGPWFGFLKPNRRIRIRETFNGVTHHVFTGFVDRWQLDYPMMGKDATATVTATDGFKLLARTDLPRSVYTYEVEQDAPVVWWRLDDTKTFTDETGVVANSGTLGDAGTGTLVGSPQLGAQGLIVHDPGTAMKVADSEANPGTPNQGVMLEDRELLNEGTWTYETWCRAEVEAPDATGDYLMSCRVGPGLGTGLVLVMATGDRFAFIVNNGSTDYDVQSATGILPWVRYHVVVTHDASRVLRMYVNGVETVGDTTTGNFLNFDTLVGHNDDIANPGQRNWRGTIGEVAIYNTALSADRVAAHYEAGSAPWQGDMPGERAHRVLDLMGWPADLRLIDEGNEPFQSASFS